MTPFWHDAHLTLYGGDCREVLAALPPGSVHCVVTSPPYWGLRDYGTATWVGGELDCDHVERMARSDAGRVSTDDRPGNINPAPVDTPIQFRGSCRRCGARRVDAQLGLEATPEEYVASMVAVFREVRRVLRDDGTLWLNLGDSYNNTDKWGGGQNPGKHTATADGYVPSHDVTRRKPPPPGLKPKDLVGIPWRVAFALQADGWYLRSDIIWAKPNPMPESVTDRPTKAHEYLFLLSKSPRYYFDGDAVREAPTSGPSDLRKMAEGLPRIGGKHPASDDRLMAASAHTNVGRQRAVGDPSGRNLRSVWTIATEPYPGAHFATFPRKLVEPCVKAGCPEGGTVLDPFAGSGTTLLVAQALGRRGVGIDLNPDYLAQALARNAQTPLGLLGGDAA